MMATKTTRRSFLIGGAALVAGCVHVQASDPVAGIEAQLGGRIGFSALDTGSGRRIQHRAGERFAMCSTFKTPLAAAVLARIDQGIVNANDILTFDPARLLSTSRTTARHNDGRISVIAACEGAVSTSDNTAANLLLDLIGGPAALTAFFHGLGDDVTRLDRYEMELNSNIDGDPRDTTTPDAMLASLQRIMLGNTLTPESRGQLTAWMLNEENGRTRLRAGLLAHDTGWHVANKPGTSVNGATNDVAIAWLPNRPPLVLAAFVTAPEADAMARQQAIAALAHTAAQEFAGG